MQHSISLSAHPVTRAPESLPPLRSLWAALSCPRGYDIRPARTPKQHGLANSLVRRMYAWRGYRTEAHRQPLEDPNHVTLAAWQYDEVVATLTLRRDSAGGLLADAHYGDVLEGLRRPDRVVCEVSRLAIDPDFSSRELLHGLFRAALDYGREHFSASDAVMEVNPRHVGYYQRCLGFQQIGDLRQCQRVDAPAVLLHQEIEEITIPDDVVLPAER
jgi:ribosomal protein S18 acetylase RimI-like enzyme